MLIPDLGLSQSQLVYLRRRTSADIKRFIVFGERCSGTNALRNFLPRRFGFRFWTRDIWKHGFPSFYAVPDDVLICVIQRHPVDWAKSLYNRPWHADTKLTNLSFSEFVRSEWAAVVDNSFMHGRFRNTELLGCSLLHDVHPITGARFQSLFQMRTIKTQAWLGCIERNLNTLVTTQEALANAPDKLAEQIGDLLSLGPRENVVAPSKKFGHHAEWQSRSWHSPDDITPEDHRYIWAQLNPDLEAQFGYTSSDR